MTEQEIIKKAYGFRGANREFSQEMGPLVEAIIDLIDSKQDKGTVTTETGSTYTLTPGDKDKTVVCGELSALTIALPQESGEPVLKDTVAAVEFVSGSTPTTLTYDSTEVSFAGGETPEIDANSRYLVAVWRDVAVCTLLGAVAEEESDDNNG